MTENSKQVIKEAKTEQERSEALGYVKVQHKGNAQELAECFSYMWGFGWCVDFIDDALMNIEDTRTDKVLFKAFNALVKGVEHGSLNSDEFRS